MESRGVTEGLLIGTRDKLVGAPIESDEVISRPPHIATDTISTLVCCNSGKREGMRLCVRVVTPLRSARSRGGRPKWRSRRKAVQWKPAPRSPKNFIQIAATTTNLAAPENLIWVAISARPAMLHVVQLLLWSLAIGHALKSGNAQMQNPRIDVRGFCRRM